MIMKDRIQPSLAQGYSWKTACSRPAAHTHSFPWAVGLCQGEKPELPGAHSHAGTVQCPQPSHPGSPWARPLLPDVPRRAWRRGGCLGVQATYVSGAVAVFSACLPSHISSQRLKGIMLNTEKEKKLRKKIFPFLPTLEKYAQVMSLFGISQRWESGKPGRALSMPSVLMMCMRQHQPLALHSTEGSF